MGKTQCDVCEGKAKTYPGQYACIYDCECCGKYLVHGHYRKELKDDSLKLAKLGYALCHGKLEKSNIKQFHKHYGEKFKKEFGDQLQLINHASLEKIFLNGSILPSPLDQADNLLIYAGRESEDFGSPLDFGNRSDSESGHNKVKKRQIQFRIGARLPGNVPRAVNLLVFEKVLQKRDNGYYCLTTEGWKRYQASEANTVFMAMDFNNPAVEKFRTDCVKAALEEEGYELRVMDDYCKEGSITDHIRNELRRAQIVIADLTENNRDVYWEAGFAEGNNKLVIYTCEKSYFDHGKEVHFDIRSIRTILWEKNDFSKTKKAIKDTIKNSLDSKF